jgi:hypothetical protein
MLRVGEPCLHPRLKMSLYRIEVTGRLDCRWTESFHGMTISTVEDHTGTTTALTGEVEDQAALRGVLGRLWDLNLTVISVTTVQAGEASRPERRPVWRL